MTDHFISELASQELQWLSKVNRVTQEATDPVPYFQGLCFLVTLETWGITFCCCVLKAATLCMSLLPRQPHTDPGPFSWTHNLHRHSCLSLSYSCHMWWLCRNSLYMANQNVSFHSDCCSCRKLYIPFSTSQPVDIVRWQNFADYLTLLHNCIIVHTHFNILPALTTVTFSLHWLQVFYLMFLSNQLKLAAVY